MTTTPKPFIQKYQWWFVPVGLLMLVAALVTRYYGHQYIIEKSQAKATVSLRQITNETLLELTKVEMTADALAQEIENHLDNPDTMFVLSSQVLQRNPAIKGCSASFEPYFFKQKGRYFSAYANSVGEEITTEQEGDDNYQYFYMDWYLIARELNKKYWIEPYEEVIDDSTSMRVVMTSYSQPLHNAEDSVVGVLSVDIPLKWLSDLILDEHPLPQSYCMLLGRGGTYIVHPDRERLIYETIITPTLEGDEPELRKLGRAMISGETGMQTLDMNGTESHVFYMPLGRIGWSLALVCPQDALLQDYGILSWLLLAVIVFAIFITLMPLWVLLGRNRQRTPAILIPLLVSCSLITSCGNESHKSQIETEADSLINEAYKMHDYERLLSLTDLHQSRQALSEMKYRYWRGYAYSRMRQMRLAEMEWTKGLDLDINNEEDQEYYAHSANRLAGVLYQKGNYEKAIRTSTTAIRLLEKEDDDKTPDYANLQAFLGCCQLRLGAQTEAVDNINKAWRCYLEVTENTDDIANYTTSIIGVLTITSTYIDIGHYQEGMEWAERLQDMLTRYKQHPMYHDDFFDKEWTRLNLYKATALQGLDRKAEAEKAYQTALATHYARTADGKIETTTYLITAQRWNEAADNFKVLEQQMRRYDMKQTLDNIHQYLQPKFVANAAANRKDSALATAAEICAALDSAILWERQNSAMELATIYETQQKETEIMEQEAEITQHRYLIIVITLILLLLALGYRIYYRHQAANRMKAAYHALEKANERAEESSRMKSEFIRQISHEIRTPLNILSGFTQVITHAGETLDETERASINQQITENTNRITDLINKMLELSDAKSQSSIEQTDLITATQIAAEAICMSGISDAPHLIFQLQVSPEVEETKLLTNKVAAVRALTLLLNNAVKFTSPILSGDNTEVKTTEKKEIVKVEISKETDLIRFVVEDTGIGVPADAAEHIFEEFVQLNNFYDGTGIGLTVARSMVQRLGGSIVLDTSYTAGARFVMTLPYHAV